ncbi:MAG: YggT family protein [Candidatus Omnitrophica bacterium]|nr:YggT family protein [Candidatus Omnitrophota bacterium]
MRETIRWILDLVIKLFELGLFATIVLNWLNPPSLFAIQRRLNQLYDHFLNPIRRYIRPIRFFRSAPVGLDLSPLILLLLIWWLIYPFLMWVFR